MSERPNPTALVYVGTYTTWQHAPLKALGIYAYQVDLASGALTLAHTMPQVSNPSFLVLDSRQRYLYAVNEVPELDGTTGGGVSAFAIEPGTGPLRYVNRQPSHGVDPCHLCLDRTGRYLLVANYTSGSVAMFP